MKYPDSVKKLFKAFEDAGRDLYLVGGAVRDYELGEPVENLDDWDFCTDSRPKETARILRSNNFQVYELGAEFGTVGAVLYGPDGEPIDVQITTYRSEEYYRRGSRHPIVEFGDTIEQDLGRRDFSINSMALDGNGDLVDPYDGKKDLQDGILRVIGDPLETLAEDPLRILRIGRFMSKLGFEPTADLRKAATERADGILDISAERWLQEMTKLLKGPFVSQSLRFLHEIRILGIILPEVDSLIGFHTTSPVPHRDLFTETLQVLEQAPRAGRLRWASLLCNIGKRWTRIVREDDTIAFPGHQKQAAMLAGEIARRFRFDNDTADEVRFLVRYHGRERQYEPQWSDAQVRRYVRRADPYVDSMLAFARATVVDVTDTGQAHTLEQIDQLEERIEALEEAGTLRPELPSGLGNGIMKTLGLKPSPMVGEVKDWLEEEIIEDRLESGREPAYYVDYLKNSPPDFLSAALSDDEE
ncbi:CCA tRNA nucleotidyltransferase [Persicimonas caeni]|nr:CCA tRNA nucleotidyltransferase [Persicimonas caeni]